MDYATDYMRHIVSWKNLQELFDTTQHSVAGDEMAAETISVQRRNVEERVDLRIIYEGIIPVSRNVEDELDSSGNITVSHAINLIISKATMASNHPVFREGENQFFVKSQQECLRQCVDAYTGFFSSVKIRINSPVLNINEITKPFYKPMSLFKYYRRGKIRGFCKPQGRNYLCTREDKNHQEAYTNCPQALKNLNTIGL